MTRARSREKNFCAARLDVVFLDDLRMAEVNWRHLRHRGPTDVLTFDYGYGSAEILISLDVAARQARHHRQTFRDELTLYLVHGMLHLAGFNDQTSKQRLRMREEERRLLREIQISRLDS